MVNSGSSAILFIGKDSYLIQKAVQDLTSKILGPSSKELDSKVFYAGEASTSEVIDHITTIPFLSSRRLVVLKDLEKASAELIDSLAKYIMNPLRTTCLVMESSEDSIIKDHPELVPHINIRRFGQMDRKKLGSWIKDYLAICNKKMEQEAVSILLELHGQDLSILVNELDKLVSFTGKRGQINACDVEGISGRSLVRSVFELADAIGNRRPSLALQICHDLIITGKREFEIVGLLCWHLKRMLRAKEMQSKGHNDYKVAASLKVSQRYRADFFRQLSITDTDGIKSNISTLLEADLGIKRTRFNPTLVLECAIVKMSRTNQAN